MAKLFKRSSLFISFLDLILIAFLVFDFGFDSSIDLRVYKSIVLPLIILGLVIFNGLKYWKFRFDPTIKKRTGYYLVILSLIILIDTLVVYVRNEGNLIDTFFMHRRIVEYGLLVYFFLRLTFLMRSIYRLYFNPAILFMGSYILVILIGTFLLMLPSATNRFISFEEALFTSTSAVCVTGLLAVPTSTEFSLFGQTIIMVLIQLGGLGMLTFTTFFAFFFKSGGSFKEGLFMKDVLGEGQLSNIMQMTVKIVLFSLAIEAIGAVLIFNSTKNLDLSRPVFFAIFHAISAFCNAGFSTMPGNLAATSLRFNYSFQWIIMVLIVFGGLGYMISLNFLKYIRQFILNFFVRKKRFVMRIITLNSKIVTYTSLILIFLGTFFFLVSEKNTVLLADRTFFGKFTTAAFSSITARTCGFGTVDYGQFTVPGLLFMIFLMWIGASPASTGGGIKTSSFALAILNVFAIARNKTNIELGTRRIATEAVRRAFAIIVISLIFIGFGILIISILDPQFSLTQIAFEVFSAFGTVGLTTGITMELSHASQYVIIMMMFMGRIGLINIMSGILKNAVAHPYEYPRENILIN